MRRSAITTSLALAAAFWISSWSRAAESVEDLLAAAKAALGKGKAEEALKLADRAVALDAASPAASTMRGMVHETMQRHTEAVKDFSRSIALDPKAADAYNHRGSEQFKLGKIDESIADFDRFLELRPKETASHWKRGISYYYAKRYDDGRKQFEEGEKVFSNDVENAVWRFLCMARTGGVAKARASILKTGTDPRVPMMEVYALFSGKAEPSDVLTATQAGKPSAEVLNERLFYAHLYLGLYYEATGDSKKALAHLTKAAEDHKIGHYMWDVARVHVELLRK